MPPAGGLCLNWSTPGGTICPVMSTDPATAMMDKNAALAADRTLLVASLCAALALLAIIAWPMLSGLTYTLNDLGDYHIPMRMFYADALAGGHSPIWTPYVYCGYYLHGDGQVGMLHPLHVALYRALPFAAAFNIELFLTFPAALLGMYLFLRRRALLRGAAMLGALLFAFSGFNLLHFVHMQAVATLAHLPWVLLAVDSSLRARTARRAAAANLAVSLLVASMLLIGYPQYVWYALLAAALYALFVKREWRGWGSAVALFAAVILGAGIGAAQLLPTYDVLSHSSRLDPAITRPDDLSLPPANLVQLVAPYLLTDRIVTYDRGGGTHEFGIYAGAVTLGLVLWLVMNLKDIQKRRLAIGALALLALSVVLSLGKFGGLYTLLSRLPILGAFRAPSRHMALAHFAMAVAAAVAAEDIIKRSGVGLRRAWWLAALPAAALAAVVLTGWPPSGWQPAWAVLSPLAADRASLLLAGPAVFAMAAALLFAAARGSRAALAAAAFLVAADLGVYGLSYLYTVPPQSIPALKASVQLPESAPLRADVTPPIDSRPVLAGHRLVRGYVGLPPQTFFDYADEAPLRIASAKYRAARLMRRDGERDKPVFTGEVVVTPVERPLQRARLVSKCVAADGRADQLLSIDPGETVILPEDAALAGGPVGTAEFVRDVPGRMQIRTNAPSRQALVISESRHAGWRARVDGRSVEVLPAYHDFLAVIVEGGSHTVDLAFEPESLRVGAYVSFGALALTLAVFIFAALVKSPSSGR